MPAMEQERVCSFETFFEEQVELSGDDAAFDLDCTFGPEQQLSQFCDGSNHVSSGRDTASQAPARTIECRCRSPSPKMFAALQAHCNPHPPSPLRALSPSRSCSSEGLASQAARFSARSSLIIVGVLVALTTAATVPKLTRMEIDKDYSHLMRRDVHTHLVREAAGAPSRPSGATAPFAGHREHSEFEARCASEYEESLNVARLRGGEVVCDHCESVHRAADRATGVLLRGGGGRARQAFKPKLSRTVDDN